MPARVRLRDALRSFVPKWLSDRDQNTGTGLFKGFSFLFGNAAAGDDMIDTMLQGIEAAWPGSGTPTALPFIGRNRGILRGEADTDASYATRLVSWLSTWRGDLPLGGGAGSQLGLALQLHQFLGNAPRVRVVNRHGYWTTVNADGTVTLNRATFDWDSISNPERAGNFSDQWVIVYPTEFAIDGQWGSDETWGGTSSFGMASTPTSVDAIVSIVRTWKRCSTNIVSLIWSYDGTLFDPTTPASLPDGTWGKAYKIVGGVAVPTRPTTCRFMEGF